MKLEDYKTRIENKYGKDTYIIPDDIPETFDSNSIYFDLKCKNGHIWHVRPIKTLEKTCNGCPECIKEQKRLEKAKETFEEIKILSNNKLELVNIDSYMGNKIPLPIKCNKCGNIFKRSLVNIRQTTECPFCEGKIMNNEQFKFRVRLLTNNEYIPLEEFKGCKNKIFFVHTRCGNIFEMTPDHFLRDERCPKCQHGSKNKGIDKFKQEVFEKYKDEYKVIGNYINNKTPIQIQHTCGNIINPTPVDFLKKDGVRCPCNNMSKGEERIFKYLTKRKLNFTYQKSFDECKNKKLLKFDFMVLLNNTMYLIEYDGEYHDQPINGIEELEKQQLRDSIKDNFCNENNIPLIRIHYSDKKDIEKILDEKLK